MREKIDDYNLLEKRLEGQKLKIYFGKEANPPFSKVLELVDIAAFRDYLRYKQTGLSVEIREGRSSYGFDIAIRTGRDEVRFFDEVFLFENEEVANWKFRAVARKIIWRDFDMANLDRSS